MLTEESRRRDFPSLTGIHYLNTAAESIPPQCVGDAIEEYWRDKLRGMRGRDAHFARVEECRDVSASFLNLDPEEVSFCSCSSEAYNLLATALVLKPEDEVVVSDLDFPAGATPWLNAAEPPLVRLWEADQGELLPGKLEALLNERTRLVQVSLVSFLNGHRLDWDPFLERVRRLAPRALVSVDLTQALGRVEPNCPGADILISSTHKWTLGIHGGCIVGIPRNNSETLTTHAGGWYHLRNAFESDRFEKADSKPGAASFSVGMPNFVSLYALDASLRYLQGVGLREIQDHADPLVEELHDGLLKNGLEPMCPFHRERPSGIVAFQHPRSEELHAALEAEEVHVMHHAGRIRLAVHGYNTRDDVARALETLGRLV
jgi:selenocysteine lyase/cysteine desulfurase